MIEREAVSEARLCDLVMRMTGDGLRNAGWKCDPADARFGCIATAVLRYAFVSTLVAVRAALHGRERATGEGQVEDVSAQTMDQNARVVRYLLDRADEMRASCDEHVA